MIFSIVPRNLILSIIRFAPSCNVHKCASIIEDDSVRMKGKEDVLQSGRHHDKAYLCTSGCHFIKSSTVSAATSPFAILVPTSVAKILEISDSTFGQADIHDSLPPSPSPADIAQTD